MTKPIIASCTCGQCTIELQRAPSRRLLCHCTICQNVYRSPFADVTVSSASAVHLPFDSPIAFKRYKSPPAIQRGTCPECGDPIVGFMTYAPRIRVAFVPVRTFPRDQEIVAPDLHVFYKTRVSDVDDTLPKYSGSLTSILAGAPLVLRALVGK